VRAGLGALLVKLDEEPALARFMVVEALAAGRDAIELRRRAVERIVACVDEGSSTMARGRPPSPVTAEGVVGGVLHVLHSRIQSRSPGRLSDLHGELTGLVLLPYLGAAAARQELDRPPPFAAAGPLSKRDGAPPAGGDAPLAGSGLRLTYRTMRVLAAILARPGASNRAVAVAAGIADQGQISKLLARLQRHGLIENRCSSSARGGANKWVLTDTGARMSSLLDGAPDGGSSFLDY
jgi:hypothetical protein